MTRHVDSFKGTPEQPLDRAEMRDKFLLLTKACDNAGDGAGVRAGAEPRGGTQSRLDQDRRKKNLRQSGPAQYNKIEKETKEMTGPIDTRMLPAEFVAIADAARCLADGGLVAFPTETVYGLGADATNGAAVARLYAAKGRPSFNPLIAHVSDLAAARRLALFDAAAERLAEAFWPGPLTLVLRKRAGCPVADLATAGLDSIAVRVPQHPVALGILGRLGRPIVAPSANRSGHVSPTTAKHVMDDLGGRIDFILDGGPAAVGVESTIVGCLDRPVLLRPGGLPREQIEAVLESTLDDPPVGAFDTEAPLAPGMLESHYAPRAQLRLDADQRQSRRGAAGVRLAAAAGHPGRRDRAEPFAERRSGRGRDQPVFRSAHARSGGRRHHRGNVGAPGGSWRSHQRPVVACCSAKGRLSEGDSVHERNAASLSPPCLRRRSRG